MQISNYHYNIIIQKGVPHLHIYPFSTSHDFVRLLSARQLLWVSFIVNSHSEKSAAIRESNHGLGVCKEHYTYYCVPKSSILLTRTGVWKISYVACGFSSIKIDYSDYKKGLISIINEVYVFFNKISI